MGNSAAARSNDLEKLVSVILCKGCLVLWLHQIADSVPCTGNVLPSGY